VTWPQRRRGAFSLVLGSPGISRSDFTTLTTQREGHVLGTLRRITQGHLLAIR